MSNEIIYDEKHFRFFYEKLTDSQQEILCIIGQNKEINKKELINESSYSRFIVYASVEALYFAGFIDFKTVGRQHVYYLTPAGFAFSEYLLSLIEKEEVR